MNDHYVPTINDMQQTMRCNMKLLVFLDQWLNSVLRILDLHIFMQRIYILFKKKMFDLFCYEWKDDFFFEKVQIWFFMQNKKQKKKKKKKQNKKTKQNKLKKTKKWCFW